ncbi:hypothetical protein Tco_1382245 [Tanacetum coccineum]
MSSFNQRGCFGCGDPLDCLLCRRCTCEWCGNNLRNGFCSICDSGAGNSFVYDPNSNSFNDPPNFFNHPPQPQCESYSCELCGNDSHYGFDCPPQYLIDQSPPQEMSIQDMEVQKQKYLEEMRSMINQIQIEDYRNMRIDIHYRRECEIEIDELKDNFNKMSIEIEKITKEKELWQREQATNLSTYTVEPSRRFNSIYYDDDNDEERTIPLNEFFSQIPPSIAITPVLPTMEPEESLIIGDENLSTIPEKESDEFIKSSVEDLVPIPRGNFVTFYNPLFNDNDAFTSSDAESHLEEDVPKENFKIYSNPLFEFDDEYISSDVNPLFNEVLEDIESEDSYVSKIDESDLLVTPLSKLNEDECFDLGGDFVLEEIKACLTSDSILPGIDDDDFDPEGDIFLLEKLLNDDPSSPLPPKELNFEELKVIKSDVSKDFKDDYYDSNGDIIYLKSLLIKDTIPNLPPEVFLDHDPRSLEDEPDKDDLKNIVKVFDPGI